MVIYINGSINSGKSTIGRLLARSLPSTIHIEVDDLRHFADCLSLDEAIPFCHEDTMTQTRSWLSRGFNVVVTWPVSERMYVDFKRESERIGRPIHMVTLRPSLDIALSDRGLRQLSDGERVRIREQYRSPHIDPGLGTVIDNSRQSPEETLAFIRTSLGV